jgi:predicted RNA-binding protein YlqC (UPF0109 family)
MKGLVETLAKALVDNPAPVEVFEAGSASDAIFRLKVEREDLGKVIGKKGRTAKAFRTLLAAAGAKQNMRVTLEILEPDAASSSTSAAPDGVPDGGADGPAREPGETE